MKPSGAQISDSQPVRYCMQGTLLKEGNVLTGVQPKNTTSPPAWAVARGTAR